MKALATTLTFMAALIICASPVRTQDHFKPVSPTADSYSIVVSAALIDSVSLDADDEIGVFTSAGLCVGAVKLASPPFTNIPIAAWKDNSQTPSVDGYTVGDTMRFRLWDHSLQYDLAAKPVYQLGDGTFENGLYALFSLSATGNRPPSVPLLLAPQQGQTATSLRWTASIDPDVGDVVRYEVQIAPDSAFAVGVIFVTTTTEELQISTVSSQLTIGEIYYWRVQALDQKNASSGFSTKWSFRYDGGVITVVAMPSADNLPQQFALHPSYPNPFLQNQFASTAIQSTIISYDLRQQVEVKLQIFDMLGRHVRTLVNQAQPAGRYAITWDGRNERHQQMASGTFIYRLQAGSFAQVRRMALVR